MRKVLLASFAILVSSAATVAGDDAKGIAQVFPSNQEGTSQLLPNQNMRRFTRCPPFKYLPIARLHCSYRRLFRNSRGQHQQGARPARPPP
jgi:hypothetical protein